MKTIFIEAKSTAAVVLPENYMRELPKKIGLVTTVQHISQLEKVKKQLEKNQKEVFYGKGSRCRYRGQILGCDVGAAEHMKDVVDAFLFIGSGEFHPLMIAMKTNRPVFKFNPETSEFSKIKKADADRISNRLKASRIKFYSSNTIGVLVSTKSGQQNIKIAEKLKKDFPEKRFHLFVFDTLDFGQLMNFPQIEFWVNTACSRIVYDDAVERNLPVINYEDL